MKIEFTAMTPAELKVTGAFILDIARMREADEGGVNTGDAVRRPSAQQVEKVTLHPEAVASDAEVPEPVVEDKPKRTRRAKPESEVAQEPVGESVPGATATGGTKESSQNLTQTETCTTDSTVANAASAAEPEKSYTMDDAREALRAYSKKHGMPEAIDFLKTFGVDRVSEIKPEQFAEFIKKAGE